MVGDKYFPELGASSLANWQNIDLSTMAFPAIMQVDYVRVYQRTGQTNVGCDPPDYPTADYISKHMEAYTSAFSFPFLPPLSDCSQSTCVRC